MRIPSIRALGATSVAIAIVKYTAGSFRSSASLSRWGFFSFFQSFFFYKILFPEVNAYWPKWVKFVGTSSSAMIIFVCLPGRFLRGTNPKLGSRYFAFLRINLIATMNSFGLSSDVRQMAASTYVMGCVCACAVGGIVNPFVVYLLYFFGPRQCSSSSSSQVSFPIDQ